MATMTGAILDLGERIAATRRPDAAPVMHQRWSELLFLHWEVPAAALEALLPPGLDLDVHDGRAYVGLVPFRVSGVRPPLLPPLPGLSSFDEVNVRTYVHRGGRDPGVWFFSLDASTRVGVATARTFFHLAYRYAEARLTVDGDRRRFLSRRVSPGPVPAGCDVGYRPQGPVRRAEPGTLEHFLVERYLLYSADGERALHRGRVHHAPYPVQDAVVHPLEEDLVSAAGIARPPSPPRAHFASAVDVEIFAIHRCD
jgi:uncharacterized protein YqjF (DUF2071 family)